jgi:teichuronic acid biosynthesis glycosyltransferase TuaC
VKLLRILTFTSLFPNSVDPTHAVFVYQRCAHLARRTGNEVLVISPVPWFPRWLKTERWRAASVLPAQEKIGELTVYHPRYFLVPKVSMLWHAVSMFLGSFQLALRLHRKAKIDCVDAHFVYPDGLAAVLLGKYLNVSVIVSARGTDINLFPSFRLIRPMIRWTLKRADGIIAVSAALKRNMVELGTPEEKILVIANGVDATRFHPVPPLTARSKLNLPANGKFFVSVGSLIPSKGHDLLVRAFSNVVQGRSDLRLYIVGDGPLRGALEGLVKDLELTESVHILRKRPNEELQLWYCAANASCLASSREGWPNVVTESLACGTPVVATAVGGIPEIVHSEELGILVERTVESMAAGMRRALETSWNREAISRQTLARTWDMVAAEVEEVLQAGVKGGAADRRKFQASENLLI